MNIDKLKDIFEKFRGFNIQDLQNIDSQQIVDLLRKRIEILISIFIVIVTIIAALVLSRAGSKKNETMDGEIKQLKKLQETIVEFKRIEEDSAAFQESFPVSIKVNELINKLSEFAMTRDVQIVSFSPAEGNSDEYIRVDRVQVNIAAVDYQNLIFFMKDIERAPYALRIKQWSAKRKEVILKSGTDEQKKNVIEVDMKIDSVTLRDK